MKEMVDLHKNYYIIVKITIHIYDVKIYIIHIIKINLFLTTYNKIIIKGQFNPSK